MTACWSSVPRSLRTDDAGCGSPSAECATTRRAVSSRASRSFSSSATRARTRGSSIRCAASVLSVESARLVAPTGATPTRSLPSRNLAIVQPPLRSPTSRSPGTRTSENQTSLTSWPPSMSSIGRTSTPGVVMSMSSIEMPACFLTSGSVRTSVKIQSPCWPSVVHVFCPLTIQSSPSRTAVVRRLARSEPASGSEKPCDHQMSRLAVFGRKRSFCSSVPNCAITGPIIEALKASGIGTPARCISSCHRCRWRSLQSWPPHSAGQWGTARPAALSTCWLATICSRDRCRPCRTASRSSCGTSVVKNSRIRSRKAVSSGVSSSCMLLLGVERGGPGRRTARWCPSCPQGGRLSPRWRRCRARPRPAAPGRRAARSR